MTVFRNFDDLCKAAAQGLQRMPKDLTREMILADPELAELCRLIDIYFDAESNPPEGVIGVGIISYAERVLQEAQGV